MVAHWLWDMVIFVNLSGAAAPTSGSNSFAGILLVAPIGLYGLWLLRKHEFRDTDDDELATARSPVTAHKAMRGALS
jgi:hypothetical protein